MIEYSGHVIYEHPIYYLNESTFLIGLSEPSSLRAEQFQSSVTQKKLGQLV